MPRCGAAIPGDAPAQPRELFKKLSRHEYGDGIINLVLDDLTRLGYVDDARYARTKALTAAEHKHHGRRRAFRNSCAQASKAM